MNDSLAHGIIPILLPGQTITIQSLAKVRKQNIKTGEFEYVPNPHIHRKNSSKLPKDWTGTSMRMTKNCSDRFYQNFVMPHTANEDRGNWSEIPGI
jgi:hypothetical protein